MPEPVAHNAEPTVPTRRRLTLAALLGMTVVGIGLSAVIVTPFVPALTWAFALAVVSDPLRLWIRSRLKSPNLAAAVPVVIVTAVILVPTALIAWKVGQQAADLFEHVTRFVDSGAARERLSQVPGGSQLYDALMGPDSGSEDAAAELEKAVVPEQAGAWLRATVWGIVQSVIAVFVLFFLFRDRDTIIETLRRYLPMSDHELDYLFERVRGMTHATIYGNLVTSACQGALGGIMFALLGIPNALLWSVAMALLSLIPSAGAFLIWLPASAMLAAQGAWGKASLLAVWGVAVVGSIDNILYPYLVGQRVRLHTLVVFLSVVGGLASFGAPGLVLGPIIVAATIAMIEILRRRTRRDRSATQPA
jgi:predicted PurR-regulated permease PerM